MTSPSPSVPVSNAVATALTAAVAAEFAATFAYGVAGPHLIAGDAAAADADQQAHLTLRAAAQAVLLAAGRAGGAPLADYPFAASDPATARSLALRVEQDAAQAWRYVIVAADGGPSGIRTMAQAALTASAVRAVRWRALLTPSAPSVPFPGI